MDTKKASRDAPCGEGKEKERKRGKNEKEDGNEPKRGDVKKGDSYDGGVGGSPDPHKGLSGGAIPTVTFSPVKNRKQRTATVTAGHQPSESPSESDTATNHVTSETLRTPPPNSVSFFSLSFSSRGPSRLFD